MPPRKKSTPLRAATEEDAAAAAAAADAAQKTVAEAAESGTQRELLVAMRRVVSKKVDDPRTSARDLAALTRRLLEIDTEIRAFDAANGEGDDVGDAAATPDAEFDEDAI